MTEARGGATVVTIIITMWRDIGFNRQHWSAHSLLPPVLTAAQLQVNKKKHSNLCCKIDEIFAADSASFFPLHVYQLFKSFCVQEKMGFMLRRSIL